MGMGITTTKATSLGQDNFALAFGMIAIGLAFNWGVAFCSILNSNLFCFHIDICICICI